MTGRRIICHLWLGRFTTEQRVSDYFAEIWNEDDQDHEDRGHTPLSEFAQDQGEKWYDHDYS